MHTSPTYAIKGSQGRTKGLAEHLRDDTMTTATAELTTEQIETVWAEARKARNFSLQQACRTMMESFSSKRVVSLMHYGIDLQDEVEEARRDIVQHLVVA